MIGLLTRGKQDGAKDHVQRQPGWGDQRLQKSRQISPLEDPFRLRHRGGGDGFKEGKRTQHRAEPRQREFSPAMTPDHEQSECCKLGKRVGERRRGWRGGRGIHDCVGLAR